MKNSAIKTIRRYLLMTFGCLLYASGVALFFSPANLASGGVSGLSIIVNYCFSSISIGTWVAIINVPIMILGIWKLGYKILLPTIYSIAVSSLFINLFEAYVPVITDDRYLCCIAGAVLVSSGIGTVFRCGSTTGGTDIIVKVIRQRFPHVPTGNIFLFADGTICLLSGIVFRNIETALISGVALFIQMYVLNTVLYGSDEARLIYIISDRDDLIAKRLLKELDVGATYLQGQGAYTGRDKKVLMCVMRMRILPQARDLVKSEDENAFMIVTKATSVFGEGFKSYAEEDL